MLFKKFLMVFIYEGVGEVVYDVMKEFKLGIKVVMVLNILFENDLVIVENYLCLSKFCFSGYDGLM